MRRFKVSKSGVGQRADVFVAAKFPQFARSALSQLFESKLVQVNKKTAKPGQKLRSGDILQLDDKLLKAQPDALPIPILYEDGDIVVMNKPAGMLTHSKGALNSESTVASFLKTKITDTSLAGNRAGIVHRLDRPTSGVIIGAKNTTALKHLQKQFSQRRTKKIYQAVAEGVPDPEMALIDAPIGRNPKKPQTFKVTSAGKPAQTEYKVLKKLTKDGKSYSLLELRPTTGRTHQIRLHLKYIGHPIVGDTLYGQAGPEMLLHATSLELTLPDRQRRTFSVRPPQAFKDFLNK